MLLTKSSGGSHHIFYNSYDSITLKELRMTVYRILFSFLLFLVVDALIEEDVGSIEDDVVSTDDDTTSWESWEDLDNDPEAMAKFLSLFDDSGLTIEEEIEKHVAGFEGFTIIKGSSDTLVSTKCANDEGNDPEYELVAGGVWECPKLCQRKKNCFGFTPSTYHNCLLWLEPLSETQVQTDAKGWHGCYQTTDKMRSNLKAPGKKNNECSEPNGIPTKNGQLECFLHKKHGDHWVMDAYFHLDEEARIFTLAITCSGSHDDIWCSAGFSPDGDPRNAYVFFSTPADRNYTANNVTDYPIADFPLAKINIYSNNRTLWFGQDELKIEDIEQSEVNGRVTNIISLDFCKMRKLLHKNLKINRKIPVIWAIGNRNVKMEGEHSSHFKKHKSRGHFLFEFKNDIHIPDERESLLPVMHMMCMVLAFCLFLPLGILVTLIDSAGYKNGEKTYLIHQKLMTAFTGTGCFGFLLIIIHRNEKLFTGNNLNTFYGILGFLHGILGFILMIGVLHQPIIQLCNCIKVRFTTNEMNHNQWLTLYSIFGITIQIVGLITGIIGSYIAHDTIIRFIIITGNVIFWSIWIFFRARKYVIGSKSLSITLSHIDKLTIPAISVTPCSKDEFKKTNSDLSFFTGKGQT